MHHANVIIGDKENAFARLPKEHQEHHVDVRHFHFERMSIDDARSLIDEVRLRPIVRTYRTFVLICDVMPPETQNALLKLFEDPNEHTLFYLIIPYQELLLPTLRSRLNVIHIGTGVHVNDSFSDFQKLSYADRLAVIVEKIKTDDTAWIAEIMKGFEQHIRMKRDSTHIQDTLLVTTYMHTPGNSKKMLLEHLALTL